MENKKEFPIRNVSIRVPWHDDGWKGTICKSPHFNNSCTILKRIADEKFDDREEENAGKSIDD